MKIVIFDINRLSFDGGAEKYLSEVGKTFKEKEDEVFFVGDCRLILKFYIWLSAFQLLNPIWKLPKLFTQLNKAPSLKPSSNKFIVHIPLKLTALCLFSRERKKVKKALEDSDLILIKNEIIEVLFFWLLGVKNQKTFVVIFSSLNYPFPQGFRAKIHNLVYGSKFYNFLVKKIGRIIVSNKEDEKYFAQKIKIEPKNIFYIPYGLDKNYFIKPGELKNTSDFKVLFVGRMEEQKGIIYLKQLIESINKDKKIEKVTFSLVGSGPLEEIPRRLAEKYPNVEYEGQLSPSEVRKCYLVSDLVVITSKWETFSYVCLEAQACGVPVVAFDIPGPRDIISGQTGALIPLGNISELQKCTFFYINDKKKNPEGYLKKRILISSSTFLRFSILSTCDFLKKAVLSRNSG